MQIKKAQFVKSAVLEADWPKDNLPQIALVGRSNVGKSSLINCLTSNQKLARTSNVPGKTRLINFYLIDESFYIVDLPGYGYANVSITEKNKWGPMIEDYLEKATNLTSIFQIVDIRHKPTKDDIQMMNWLKHFDFKTAVIASKSDKISKSAVNQSITTIRATLLREVGMEIIPFSAETGQGKREVLALIAQYLKTD